MDVIWKNSISFDSDCSRILKPQLINITIDITNSTLYFRKFIFFLHKLLIQTHFLKNFDFEEVSAK